MENRDNHGRVKAFANVLKKRGYSVFFDEEEMNGNIYDRMANAIDNSTVFLAFLSRGYIDRVMSEDHNNCRYEFNIAIPKGKKAMAVVMEVGEKNMPLTHVPNWPGKISGLMAVNYILITLLMESLKMRSNKCTQNLTDGKTKSKSSQINDRRYVFGQAVPGCTQSMYVCRSTAM